MKPNLSTQIPFAGFYESVYSYELDQEEIHFCEYLAEESEDGERSHAEPLRLDAGELAECLWRGNTNYRKAHEILARDYAETFNHIASDELGFPLGLVFDEMTSPREYNFATDRIFCSVPRATVAKLFRISKAEGHKTLAAVIADNFTSYDGFYSHYPNHLGAWLAKRLSNWDHNEVYTLLASVLKIKGADDVADDCFDSMACNGSFSDAFDAAVNWPGFEEAREEKRAEKLAELTAEERADVSAFVPRCPYTRDMFREAGL